ncbi:MAG: OmpH family outer membrane protein [Proteobacteria bacterium]|nr:OmpH family outer membrane protein [Pseudomonadota bacterium]
MQTFKTAFWTMVVFSLIVTSSYGADVAKIGIIDFQKILETSNAGKKAQAEISKAGKKMEADLKQKGAEIEEVKQKLEREALVMSQEMRAEREREIRIKINDIKSLQQQYRSEFKLHEQRLVGNIQKEIFELVEEIGKKEGYLLILEKREAGVLYAPDTMDITDQLIKAYNAKFAQQEEGSKNSPKK